jgi:conjugative transposon TraM protein
MIKINFKQPKYIFPPVIFVPLCAMIYFIMQTFGANKASQQMAATDRINMELPEGNAEEAGDKLTEMTRRYGDKDAYTAIGGLEDEKTDEEQLEHGYSDAELDRIDAAEAERLRKQREMEELERSLAESKRHINSYAYGNDGNAGSRSSSGSRGYGGAYGNGNDSDDDYTRDLEAIQRRSQQRQKDIERALGISQDTDFDADERLHRQLADSLQREQRKEKERNRPNKVRKAMAANSDKFHTITAGNAAVDAKLIRAMIDCTTKAREGTRLRFKLLDAVTVSGVHLAKGTYLYGTVTGFGSQRVKVEITSILVGDRFIKVKLSVYDNDGMEGFYVPESAFREFVKEAGANAAQQNINMQTNTGYGGVSAEAIALQTLQNMYQSASSAISNNIRKNNAKIKYNTIVYLINSEDAK